MLLLLLGMGSSLDWQLHFLLRLLQTDKAGD